MYLVLKPINHAPSTSWEGTWIHRDIESRTSHQPTGVSIAAAVNQTQITLLAVTWTLRKDVSRKRNCSSLSNPQERRSNSIYLWFMWYIELVNAIITHFITGGHHLVLKSSGKQLFDFFLGSCFYVKARLKSSLLATSETCLIWTLHRVACPV